MPSPIRLATSIPVGQPDTPQAMARRVADLERAGIDIVWVGEGYGFDVPSTLGYLAAVTERVQIGSSILNVYSRSPALLAQTAAGVDWLSGGRAMLGLGTSGPQVIEGFHGVSFERPVQRIREIVEICRKVWRREPLIHDGEVFQLPKPDSLGKPIKLMSYPVRDRIPIWWGSLGPRAVEATAEVADGWLTFLYVPERAASVWGGALARGAAKRDPLLDPLEIQAGGKVAIGDDVDADALREAERAHVALYVGGMGAPGANFYNDVLAAYGWEAEAAEIQRLYLGGKRTEAAAVVPAEFLEKITLFGSPGYIRERLAAHRESGVTVLTVDPIGPDPLRTIEALRRLLDE